MRRVAFWMSVATILALNIVIWLGVLGRGETLLFGGMLAALHVVLPISSILMLVLLVRDRHWAAASAVTAIVIGMLAVVGLRLASVHLSGGLHLAGDVFVLNVYLIVVPWSRYFTRNTHTA